MTNHVPGSALPVKQERSRQLRDRLLRSSRALIDAGGFTGTSMTDIARAAQCSVGALYFRFKDKEALFDSVVEVAMAEAMAEAETRVAAGRYERANLKGTIACCIGDYLGFVRRNEGLIRALHQRTIEDPRRWGILRETAATMVSHWAKAIAASAGRPDDRACLRQINIAFQFVSGVLVHAILIRPTLLDLNDPEFELTVQAMMENLIAFDGSKALASKTRMKRSTRKPSGQ